MISIQNFQDKIKVNKKLIASDALKVLKSLGAANADLSIVIVDNLQIKRLNKEYLGKNCATDVLAFSMKEGRSVKGDKKLLGDLVISAEMARDLSRQNSISWRKELDLYLIHGILHLFGFKDGTLMQRNRIFKKQEQVLKKIWKEKASRKA